MLYQPCNPHILHGCCTNQGGDCICCNEEDCLWDYDFDPWTQVQVNFTAYDKFADSVLTVVSESKLSETPRQSFLAQSYYLFSRIAAVLHSMNTFRLQNVLSTAEAHLSTLRTALLKLNDALKLIQTYAQRNSFLLIHELNKFLPQNSTLSSGLSSSLELVCLALSFLLREPTQIQKSQSSQQSQNSLPDSLQSADALYRGFTTDAENAIELARSRVRTANSTTALIASLQIQKLANNLEEAYQKINTHALALAARQNRKPFARNFSDYATRVAAAKLIVTECAQKAKQATTSSADSNPKKTPSKSKPQPAFASPRAEAQQATIDCFFNRVASKANMLQRIPLEEGAPLDCLNLDPALPPHQTATSGHNSQHSSDSQTYMSDEQLHEAMMEGRAEAGSTAHHFMAEAFNALSNNPDSNQSQVSEDSVIRDSDISFIGSSSVEIEDELHPRAQFVRKEIRNATKHLDFTPAARVHTLKPAFCPRGHLVRLRAAFSKGNTLKCNACLKMFSQDLFSCHCFRYYACLSCIDNDKIHPPPPDCPNLSCSNKCKFQHKNIATTCTQGSHPILPNENAWFCSDRQCKAVMCVDCRLQRSAIPSQEIITDSFNLRAFEQLRPPPPDSPPLNPHSPRRNSDPSSTSNSKGHISTRSLSRA
jgi:hypothetical protein